MSIMCKLNNIMPEEKKCGIIYLKWLKLKLGDEINLVYILNRNNLLTVAILIIEFELDR